jgi:hypothetical protein
LLEKDKRIAPFLILMKVNPDHWMSVRIKRNMNPVLDPAIPPGIWSDQ